MTDDDAGDVLYGVGAIAEWLGMPRRAAQHKVDTGALPTFRLGRSICARKSTLTRHIAEQETAEQHRQEEARKAAREASAIPGDDRGAPGGRRRRGVIRTAIPV